MIDNPLRGFDFPTQNALLDIRHFEFGVLHGMFNSVLDDLSRPNARVTRIFNNIAEILRGKQTVEHYFDEIEGILLRPIDGCLHEIPDIAIDQRHMHPARQGRAVNRAFFHRGVHSLKGIDRFHSFLDRTTILQQSQPGSVIVQVKYPSRPSDSHWPLSP